MYQGLFGRIEKYRPAEDIGFEFPGGKIPKSKTDVLNEVRRRKKIGDMPPVYPNGWFCLIRSNELVVCASTSVNAIGENFALFRDEEGCVHILDAYCAHLGANLAVGGKVRYTSIHLPLICLYYITHLPLYLHVGEWQVYRVSFPWLAV